MKFGQDDVDAVTLAVGEACANALSHGNNASSEASVHVSCRWIAPDRMRIDIENLGSAFRANVQELSQLPPADSYATHGRGFALMNALVDEIDIHTNGVTTTVSLVKYRQNSL